MEWQLPALVLAIGYLLGSIPFGLVLTRLAGVAELEKEANLNARGVQTPRGVVDVLDLGALLHRVQDFL